MMLIELQRGKVFVRGGIPKLSSLLSPSAKAEPALCSLLGRMMSDKLDPVEMGGMLLEPNERLTFPPLPKIRAISCPPGSVEG